MYSIYNQVAERLKHYGEEVTAEIMQSKVDQALLVRWSIGFQDRGMAHGDYAVITEDGLTIVKCPGKAFAEHIVELHNATIPKPMYISIGITKELISKFILFVEERQIVWNWINETAFDEGIDKVASVEMQEKDINKWKEYIK